MSREPDAELEAKAEKFVRNQDKLKSFVQSALQRRYRRKSLVTHLNDSWSNRCFAGDLVVLDMLQAGKYQPYIMHSWLSFYSTMTDRDWDDQARILGIIGQHYPAWREWTAEGADLVEAIYRKVRLEGQRNRFVMATKVAWLMCPERVVIYDGLVGSALGSLADRYFLEWVPSIRQDTNSLGGEPAVQRTLKAYRRIDAMVRDICSVCEGDLAKYLRANKRALPTALQANRLRLLDKLLWGYGGIVRRRRMGRRA